jgi:hypothetical protein
MKRRRREDHAPRDRLLSISGLSTDEIASSSLEAIRTKELKERFLCCLGTFSTKAPSFRSVVQSLLLRGVHWKELARLATAHGHKDKYVRKLLSEILTDLGIRRRHPGAGRETPQQALLLLAYARSNYGEDAVKFLGAAHRAGRAEAAEKESSMPSSQIRALRLVTRDLA